VLNQNRMTLDIFGHEGCQRGVKWACLDGHAYMANQRHAELGNQSNPGASVPITLTLGTNREKAAIPFPDALAFFAEPLGG
jgi:hypothetical protein